jgi:hypothetical protein
MMIQHAGAEAVSALQKHGGQIAVALKEKYKL